MATSLMRLMPMFLTLWCGYAAAQPSTAVIPLEQFTQANELDHVQISPDGKTLVYTMGKNGRSQIACVDLKGNQRSILRLPEGYEVDSLHWASATQLVFFTNSPRTGEARPRLNAQMYSVDDRCQKSRLVYGIHATPNTTGTHLPQPLQDRSTPRFLGAVDRDQVLVSEHPWRETGFAIYYNYNDPDAVPKLALLDLNTAQRKTLGRVPLEGPQLLLDAKRAVRFAVGREGTAMRMLWRIRDDAPWQQIELPELLAQTVEPQGFSADGARVLVTAVARGANYSALYSIELSQQKVELLQAFEAADVGQVLRDMAGSGEIIGITSAADPAQIYWLNPTHPLARAYRALQKSYPGQDVVLTSATADASRAIVRISSDVDPGAYFLLDTRQLRADFLHAQRAWLDPKQMLAKRPIELQVRDGIKLQGFVTTPRGRAPFPMVVLPHDGPDARDTRSFDPIVQLLASRGYAVLQINYRGSIGYGLQFTAAGDGQWGARMQDDVTDATRWAIAERIADASRIAIFGSGYGGYAALAGVIREPQLYRCAIGLGGYYDLELLLKERNFHFAERQYFDRALGRDREALREASPVNNAARIEVPVLLVHGERDFIVSAEHAKRMHAALQRRDKQVELMMLEREGHEIYDAQARRETYQRVLDFLEAHLQPAVPLPAASVPSELSERQE